MLGQRKEAGKAVWAEPERGRGGVQVMVKSEAAEMEEVAREVEAVEMLLTNPILPPPVSWRRCRTSIFGRVS